MAITARPPQGEEKLRYGIFPADEPSRLLPLIAARSINELSRNYKIYSPQEINLLLQTAREKSTEDCIAVRFLLRENNELVFAEEGWPGPTRTAPAHLQMASFYSYTADKQTHYALLQKMATEGACISAGNAFFNKENELVKIDNKSGDFHPPFNSLRFALNVIIDLIKSNKIKASKNLIVSESIGEQHTTLNISDYLSHKPLEIVTSVHSQEIVQHPKNESDPYALDPHPLLQRFNQAMKKHPKDSPLYKAARLVRKEAKNLASISLKDDLKKWKTSVILALSILETPKDSSEYPKVVQLLKTNADHDAIGKSDGWKQFKGALVLLVGAAIIGLSIAGVPFTGGASLTGFYLAGSLFSMGGAAFFYRHRQKSLAKTAAHLANAANSPV